MKVQNNAAVDRDDAATRMSELATLNRVLRYGCREDLVRGIMKNYRALNMDEAQLCNYAVREKKVMKMMRRVWRVWTNAQARR